MSTTVAGFDIAEYRRRMEGALATLKNEFSGLRTGRASTTMLDPIQVEAYGSMMPLAQLATVSAPEPRMLSVQVWDKTMVKAVEKAIISSGMGFNPMTDGQLLRIPLPDLSAERRKELVKLAAKYAEAAKVSIRNVRRDGMDRVKKLEKDGDISEDQQRNLSDDLQKLTDDLVKKVDESLASKEKDILQV